MNCTIDLSDRLCPEPKKKSLTLAEKKARQASIVEAAFRAEDYTLLSKYERNSQRLEFECPSGHFHRITWKEFSKGGRCAYCAGAIVTHDQVEALFTAEGCKLLSSYKNSRQKLEYECLKGHRHRIKLDNFRKGHRCANCAGQVITHERVESEFRSAGYDLLSRYENNNRKLEFTCLNGHRHSMTWANFRKGHRCANCAGRVITHEHVESEFRSAGYDLLSRYENNNRKLEFTCLNGHRHSMTWANFRKGKRCAHCAECGYNPEKPGTLYYIRFDLPIGKSIYKIGITNKTVKRRFAAEPTPYTIIWQQQFDDGRVPQQMEKEILKKHRKHRYEGNALKSGNTECFTIDVLGYDCPIVQLKLIA